MGAYVIRRLLFMIPTLFVIMLLNFTIIQFAPGGPVEQTIAEIRGMSAAGGATSRVSGSAGGAEAGATGGSTRDQQVQRAGQSSSGTKYRGAQGLSQRMIDEIERRYGFDKPAHVRFINMLTSYLRFDFGDSLFKGEPVSRLILRRMPVSISLGLWTTLIAYSVSIPLGIAKAVRDGERFDILSSAMIISLYAIPGFLFAVLLIILFAGGEYFQLFPLRGLVSSGWGAMPWSERIMDYFWHITLPVFALVIGDFAGLTMLTKNSFLDEINKDYVRTARSKGLTERAVLYGHVFRNAMLIVIAGFPSAFVRIFFTGSLLIEVIFSIEGLGLLGFEAIVSRDYPIVFATMYIYSLMGLVLQLITDLTYTFVDPRIDFESRGS
jgi:microcin C transport system permease protein